MQRTPRTDNHPGIPEITLAPRPADKKIYRRGKKPPEKKNLTDWYVKTYPIDRKSHVKKIDKKSLTEKKT